MFKNLINSYILNLTKQDIIDFSKKQNVTLNNDEVNIIYDEIKNNTDNVLYNTDKELEKIKDKLQYTTYLKIKELILIYIEKYKNYL